MSVSKIPLDKGSYIAGFTDGEGSFFISARKKSDYPSGWRFTINFNLSNGDLAILEICKQHIGAGKIRVSRKATATRRAHYLFEIETITLHRSKIIPFFTRFRFLSNKKKAEFRVFIKAVEFFEKVRVVETLEQLEHFFELRRQLSLYRSGRVDNTDDIIRKSFTPITGEKTQGGSPAEGGQAFNGKNLN